MSRESERDDKEEEVNINVQTISCSCYTAVYSGDICQVLCLVTPMTLVSS